MLKLTLFLLTILLFSSCEPLAENAQESRTGFAVESNDSVNLALEKLRTEELQKADSPPPVYEEEPLNPNFPYHVDLPDRTFKLKSELNEISGLSLAPNKLLLVAINDEKGELYFIDKNTGFEEYEVDFGKNKDYEGVETVGDEVYVVESDGQLRRVQRINTKDQDTDDFENKLGRKYDVEGLTYDERNDRLLLACKGKAGEGDEFKKKRAIYAFDLKEKEYSKEPVFLISRKEIEDYVKTQQESGGKLASFLRSLDPDRAADAFAPSAIGIHPKTQNMYVLSTVGKLLVVLNPAGVILHIQQLDASIHRQPEGICFDADGTMYIANEGKGKRGRIHKFKPIFAEN